MDSSSTKQQCSNKDSTNKTSQEQKKVDIGLYNFSYADFIILSSTLAYALSEELNDMDLDILISFFGMLTADLGMLRTKNGINQKLSSAQNNGESAIIGATEATQSAEIVSDGLSRNNRKVKKKKIHKKPHRDKLKKDKI